MRVNAPRSAFAPSTIKISKKSKIGGYLGKFGKIAQVSCTKRTRRKRKMILAYTGTPGSGKSFHAVKDIWERVKYGHEVVSNIPMSFPKKCKNTGAYVFKETYEINPKYLMTFSEGVRERKHIKRLPEDYIYLVIDEAQLIFNCRNWGDKERKEWVKFFTLHRKLGYKVILITQMSKMLDNQIRGLLEYEIIHRKFSNFGLRGWFISLVLCSPTLFACVRVWSAMNERIDCEILRYSRRIAKMYDTSKLY